MSVDLGLLLVVLAVVAWLLGWDGSDRVILHAIGSTLLIGSGTGTFNRVGSMPWPGRIKFRRTDSFARL